MRYDDRYQPPHTYTRHTATQTSYPDTPAANYFARLSEKAAPSGTVHLHSYETSPSDYRRASEYCTSDYRTSDYRQPVCYARPPERVVREVREVRGPERYGGREPVRVERVENVLREREGGRVKEVGRQGEGRGKGVVGKGVVGKGAGAIWKALGGR
ncbi:hypothetical protein PMIN01_09385 [Paraphaeosphaeria minitans]|uniref:Uncharacterized protein n=1 Tax=Paraphaeosphaeria minitans TaxID=565426 RepID=A0A9P6GB83_9PLEO|nr:hypothetical protein PMIN01_09385 [Paraphaeosphaeria minitans]